MRFEYDHAKSAANKAKHGIDFEEAKALWDDSKTITLKSAYPAEERYLVVGVLGGKLWTAIVSHRGERLRIISVRRTREDEAEKYYSRRTR